MHFRPRISSIWSSLVFAFFIAASGLATHTAAQSTYTAQLSGVVTDASGGVIPGAKVTPTDEATGVGTSYSTRQPGSTPRHTQFGLRFQF
jgi:hypothetical protein